MANILLALKALAQVEREKTWEGINSPADLINLLCKHVIVDPNSISRLFDIVYSDDIPTSEEDTAKIWIKTSIPQGIGIPQATGEYHMLYEFPVDIPFLWIKRRGDIPSYLVKLSASQLSNYSLTEPTQEGTSWVIFESE